MITSMGYYVPLKLENVQATFFGILNLQLIDLVGEALSLQLQ